MGQGKVSNPYSDFASHVLISVDGVVYDPSYGEKYRSFEKWEEKAVEGFFSVLPGRLIETKDRKDLNGDGVIEDVPWLELHFRKRTSGSNFNWHDE